MERRGLRRLPEPDSNRPRPAGGGRARIDLEDLLTLIAGGDRAALLSLYDAASPALMAVAWRVTRVRSDAEEVVQDAFLRAWREAASFDGARGSALAWLVTLARNRALDVVRMRGRRSRHEGEAAEAEARESSPGPERALVDVQRTRTVRDALASLGPDQRAALDLAYFGGLSHGEIAARLGLPLGTVKTRILLAVRHLRARLADRAPSSGES